MPYIARHKEADLTALEHAARKRRKVHESYQKYVMGQKPLHTSLAMDLSKTILVPLSRMRVTNGFFRRVGMLDRVQEARVRLLDDDLARADMVDQEERLWYVRSEIQRLAGGARECYLEFAFHF